MGIKETLGFIFSADNFPLYRNLFLILGILAFNGLIIFRLIYQTANKLLLLGGGMIMGLLAFLLFLCTFSYVLKDPTGIALIFGIYTAFCLLLFIKNLSGFKTLTRIKLSPVSLLCILVILIYLSAIALYTRSYIYGGDVFTYWGIATSFARGNYPTVLPWQPQYLTTYHDGTALIQGAIKSITSINIPLVYSFFSFYIFSGLFFLITGLAREKTRSLISLLPANLGLILFGGPLLYKGSWNIFLQKLIRFDPNFFIQFDSFKGSLGAGANSTDGLFYLNFYTFGLGVFFIFLYTLPHAFKKSIYKYLLLILLLALTLSITETLFVIEVPLLVIYFLYEQQRQSLKLTLLRIVFLSGLSVILFSLIPNVFRDSLLSPLTGLSRLKLLKSNDLDFVDRVNYLKDRVIDSWYMPDLRLSLLLLLAISIWRRSKWAIILGVSCLVSLLLSFLLVDRFWPPSGLRFLNQSFQLLLLALGFLLVELLRSKKGPFLAGIILLLLILPQLIGSNLLFFYKALYRDDINLTRDLHTKDETLDWINKNLPVSERIIFIDGYPFSSKNSPMSEYAIQFYGIFVPTAPTKVRIKNVDMGGEWFDAMVTLSPAALNTLGVDFAFIQNTQISRFSYERKLQLTDTTYFQPVYKNNSGVLYRVSDKFKKLSDSEISLGKIESLIPDGKIVYLDRLPIPAARKGLLVDLANRTDLIGPRYNLGDDYFVYVMASLPLKVTDFPNAEKEVPELKKIDFVITSAENDPNLTLKGTFQKVAEMPFVALWQKH